MSVEAGVLINKKGLPFYWHEPRDASAVLLPDSERLWSVIWQHRKRVKGFAHSHPGKGTPAPSHTDLTTFQAIEAALGRRLTWWICSEDELIMVSWYQAGQRYLVIPANHMQLSWLNELRLRSYNTNKQGEAS